MVIDTNAVFGLLDVRDVHHPNVVRLVQKLEEDGKEFVPMDCIILKLYFAMARRSKVLDLIVASGEMLNYQDAPIIL